MQRLSSIEQRDPALKEIAAMALSKEDFAAYLASVQSQNKIFPRPPQSLVPLSFGQEQLWLHSLLAPELPLYNETVTVRYRGNLWSSALEQSLNEVVRRHEIYRTSIRLEDGVPFQEIAAWEPIPFRHADLRGWSRDGREDEAIRLATESARILFDFSKAPLLRALVVTLADDDHRLFLTLHHLIFDGVAIRNSLLPELVQLYASFSAGQRPSLRPPELQYGDYAYWQRNQAAAKRSQAATYWKSQVADLPVLRLPIARPRTPATGFKGAALRFELNQSLVGALRARAPLEQATFFNLLLAGFLILLSRYSGQTDFGVGTVSAGRSHPEFEALPGYFLSTLILRTDLSGRPDFHEVLARVQQVTVSALSHEELPFMELVREICPTRDMSSPLVQVMFSMEPPQGHLDFPWELVEFDVENGAARIDLHLEVDERPEQLTGRILYNTGIFERSAIQQILEDWETILRTIAAGSEECLWNPPLAGVVHNYRHALIQDQSSQEFAEPPAPQFAKGSVSARDDAPVDEAVKHTEELLAAMWCELLQVDHAGRNENFFDLGGHSLLGARFLARVAQKFTQRLSFASLIQAPTIAQFAPLLHGGSTSQTTVYKESPSSKTRLLWIGLASWLHLLAAHLRDENSIYSIALSRAEQDGLSSGYKMEELAHVIVKKIRDLQQQGPYFLGGFCLSAVIAYECAQQLRKAGCDVELLVLGDALPPGDAPRDSLPERIGEKSRRLRFHLGVMRELPPSRWVSYTQRRAEIFKHTYSTRKGLRDARSNYRPVPYHGKILFLESGALTREAELRSAGAWGGLLPNCDVYQGPPGNTSFFDEDYILHAALKIQTALDHPGILARTPEPSTQRSPLAAV